MRPLVAILFALAAPGSAQGTDRTVLATQLEALAAKDPEATYHLGMMRHLGIAGAKDEKAAFLLFKKAANAGDPLAAYKLGDYYARSDNAQVAVDKDEALRLKTIAAEAGYALAEHDVARLHFELGNAEAAIEWLTRAARQGHPDALRALASLYNSNAVPKDAALTFAYYSLYLKRLAAPTDKQTAFLTEFAETISAEDKARGEKIIADWKTEPSALTRKALAGLRAAEALVGKQQGASR